MSQDRLTLHDILPAQALADSIDAGYVTRKSHPELPLSIYTYTRTAQYERVWNQVTTRCRGLVADDTTGAIVALPLPKFFNVGEHESGQPYAPALPDEPFEVYDKVDGSLAVVFHYADRWRVASKGSFISAQATWAQRLLDTRDTAALRPGTTYLAEILYPQNRIVVDYGNRRDLVLLAAFGADGTEVPLAEAAPHWQGIGSVVTVWPAMPLDELIALTESNTLPGGAAANGTDAEGFVLRFASGVRAKAKLSEYVRLHKVLTGVNERDIWRGHGIQRFAGLPAKQLAQGLNCTVADIEASGGKPLDALLEQVPDEFDTWVREVIDRLEGEAARHEQAIDEAYAGLVHLAGDRGAFARAVRELEDREIRPAMFMRLDGRPTELTTWRHVRPETGDPYTTDEEDQAVSEAAPEAVRAPVPKAAPEVAPKAAPRVPGPAPAAARPEDRAPQEPALPVVHVMTGLPASGKTTAARALQARSGGRMRRVNLDDLRRMLDLPDPERGRSYAHEQTVLAVQDAAVRAAVDGGFDVVVDNTHLTKHIPKRLKAAVGGLATFVVHDFTDVPLEECLRRDAAREDQVGEEIIRILADKHQKARKGGWRLTAEWLNGTSGETAVPPVREYVADPALPAAVMCDIDGTLALIGDRGPYDFSRCELDRLNEPVRHALDAFRRADGDVIVLLSGRSEEHRPQTESWLARHRVPYDELWMRAAGDTRRDDVVKAELFDAHVRHRYAVRVSLDDRDRVVAVWRRMGLPTWQVNYGDF
ncbi:AAA family ATPase [Streptomyces sp. NBC_00162]|uniref:phosphatase domain-containing protein n=1 Tax=Streptomyces sp. NBC_00162 TaxID=2903629 RepID=UPI00214B5FE7|nr:AAA family ATPase [Streptomyces sp. NBC_00162]UUU38555.1 AAA family ATPase [Streptomyces sp. NBC_00162]